MTMALAATLAFCATARAQVAEVSVTGEVVAEIGPLFHGIQYHDQTYAAPAALEKLAALPLRAVRVWAYPAQFHPEPGVWDWSALDEALGEVTAVGYVPFVGIFQAEDWYTGTPDDPWWNDADARAEWSAAVGALAERYAEEVEQWIVFDEINYLHADRPYFMPLDLSAALYIAAAEVIGEADPGAKVGGPSGFAGWENGYWAQRVLAQPGGAAALDFVSSNLFLSWDAEDTDAAIMERTIWYEEAAARIRAMVGEGPSLVLDAFNVSALWTKDGTREGELWTDPRNVDTFGGVVQTLAFLHAAKGGFDVALRWETLGGFGVLRWYPAFEPRPPYFAWQLLAGPGRLMPGSQLLATTTTEPPLTDLPHHSGQNVAGYHVQPFALRDDSGTSVIVVNKSTAPRAVRLAMPSGSARVRVYRFDEGRHAGATEPLTDAPASATLTLSLPPVSVTVARYESAATSADLAPPPPELALTVAPNPVGDAARFTLTSDQPGEARVEVFAVDGRRVAEVLAGRVVAGAKVVAWDASALPSGAYLARACVAQVCVSEAFLRLR